MSHPTISARVCEVEGGAYYDVLLHAIPHTAELIELYSFLDQATNQYEIVHVVHKIHDVTEKFPHSKDGCHEINIYVKPIQSGFPDE